MIKSLYAPNGSLMETQSSIERRTAAMVSVNALLGGNMMSETAAAYAMPQTGSMPNGLGYNFGDSWRRTQRGTMEFNLPAGQNETINMAFRYAMENVFVGKALRIRTHFTCKGVQNAGPNDETNTFFDGILKNLSLEDVYRKAVWLYNMAGLVPILISEPGKPLDYLEIVDPRMVRVQRSFGKLKMWLIPDARMLAAARDPKGTQHPSNKFYWDAMPDYWKAQLKTIIQKGIPGSDNLIDLKDDTYIVIENRDNPFDRTFGAFDGIPLQPYFAACEQYRMLMSGDFAAAFLAKNLIALVSVGDPKAEGKELYQRPDDTTLMNLQASFQNPNQAQWSFVDPTLNIRYITPDKDVFASEKYEEPKEQLKNLLPSPFWYNDGSGSFAGSTTEMTSLQEDCESCNDTMDRNFWEPIYERASYGKPRIAKKDIRAPKHDTNALKDPKALQESNSGLYANGGLSVRSLIESHGYDFDVEKARKEAEKSDVKKGTWTPAFEQKQGIVANKTYGIKPPAGAGKSGGKGGRKKKAGSKPQAESKGRRTPRPSERK